jgi:hypothetical protein
MTDAVGLVEAGHYVLKGKCGLQDEIFIQIVVARWCQEKVMSRRRTARR